VSRSGPKLPAVDWRGTTYEYVGTETIGSGCLRRGRGSIVPLFVTAFSHVVHRQLTSGMVADALGVGNKRKS
jgi:hypothetical protein